MPPVDPRTRQAVYDAFWHPFRPALGETATQAEPICSTDRRPLLKGSIGDALDRVMRDLADAEAVLESLLLDHTTRGAEGWRFLMLARLAVGGAAAAIHKARPDLPVGEKADPIPF